MFRTPDKQRELLLRIMVTVILVGASLWQISPWGQNLEEGFGLDLLFHLRGSRPPPSDVVIISADENSAPTLGLPSRQENWSRFVYAKLVDHLTDMSCRLIVFDIFFKEPRDSSSDRMFANSLSRADKVILFASTEREIKGVGRQQLVIDRIEEPLQLLRQSARSTAPFMLPKVSSKVTRFWTRWMGIPVRWTLPAAAFVLQSESPATMEMRLAAIPRVQLYNYYGPPRSITTIPLQEILQHPAKFRNTVDGAVVFVGYSAQYQPGQKDGFYTPYTARSGLDISGVELAATAFANLSEDSSIRHSPWAWVAVVWLYGAAMLLAGIRLPHVRGLAVMLGLALVYAAVVYLLFTRIFYWLSIVTPLLLLTPAALLLTAWHRAGLIAEQKLRLEKTFGRYLPAAEIRRLANEPERFAERERVFGVCLVTDAEGYTATAERLGAERLGLLMESYYEAVIAPIRGHGGIISDVAGDGIIAIWPHVNPEDLWPTIKPAVKAVRQSVAVFNRQHSENPLPTRVGVHAGECVLGHFGASDHFEYRAMGDLVNTTSRIENACKSIGLKVLISEACINSRIDPELRYLGKFLLQGKRHPMELFSTIESPWSHHREMRFRWALEELGGERSGEAIAELKSLHRETADPVSHFYWRYCDNDAWRERHFSGAEIVIELAKS